MLEDGGSNKQGELRMIMLAPVRHACEVIV